MMQPVFRMLSWSIVKTQLNHNQVKPPPPPVKLGVVVVQLRSNQQQITDKSYQTQIEFVQTKFPTQMFLTL